MVKKYSLKNISLFANSGVGEFGTKQVSLMFNDEQYNINTIIANELLKERAELYTLNYPNTIMVNDDITKKTTIERLKDLYLKELPSTGTFSPPCQGSSGLNAHKNSKYDFRNQLVKSIFQLLNDNDVKKYPLEFGYIENVVSYYKETIPCLIYDDFERPQKPKLFHQYIYNTENKLINYNNFILHKDKDVILKIYDMIDTRVNIEEYIINETKFYGIPFDSFDSIFMHKARLINIIRDIDKSVSLILSLDIKTYISESFKELGYFTNFITLDGTNCKCPQIRKRTFCTFTKFPYQNNFSKKQELVTVKDVFIKNGLIEKYDLNINPLQDLINSGKLEKPYKIINNELFIDNIQSIEYSNKQYLLYKSGCTVDTISFLHSDVNTLNKRYLQWLSNTKENSSAYFNMQRIHRPYKLLKVTKKDGVISTTRDMNFVIEEDTKEYFKENNIIDYATFVTDDMKQLEGIEWNDEEFDGVRKNGRKWLIRNKKSLNIIENNMRIYAEMMLVNPDCKCVYLFTPILGFEMATYKRIPFNKPSNALTTKMQYGNSNTAHPIFDRLLTPYEVMLLFTLNVDKNMYPTSNQYLVPNDKRDLKGLYNFVYEICGEAIIPLVSTYLLEDILEQDLKFKNTKYYPN